MKAQCYEKIQYKKDPEEVISVGQCILVCADSENFVGKVLAFFQCPNTGLSLFSTFQIVVFTHSGPRVFPLMFQILNNNFAKFETIMIER